jgi:hypothetical protein
MAGRALSIGTQALLATSSVGIPWTEPLIDATPLGSFWCRVGVTIGTGDTNVVIQLPRKPSGYIVVRRSNAGVIYDGSTPANWTGTLITLRSTSAGNVVTILVG